MVFYVPIEVRSTGRGQETVEVPPETCPNGHPLRGNLRVFWGTPPEPDAQPCRGWRCRTCDQVTWAR